MSLQAGRKQRAGGAGVSAGRRGMILDAHEESACMALLAMVWMRSTGSKARCCNSTAAALASADAGERS